MQFAKRHGWKVLTLGLAGLSVVLTYQACGEFKVGHEALSSIGALATDPIISKSCGPQQKAGHAMIHRLSHNEYNNTVRDLLYTTSQPANSFTSSSRGGTGFSNESVALTVTNSLVADYVTAAEQLANEVVASKSDPNGSFAKLAPCALSGSADEACAQSAIRNLASRAYRRPVSEGSSTSELEMLMNVFRGGGNFDQGFHDVLVAVLIDPNFLFIHFDHPQPNNPNMTVTLNNYDLATRMSYFIWQSMPDAALFRAAMEGKLSNPDEIRAQVTRMVKDPKAKAMAETLRTDWAFVGGLDSGTVDGMDASTLAAIRQETKSFLEDLVTSDRSLLTLVDADYTFANETLAQFYGIQGVIGQDFRKVSLPGRERRGLMTQASVLITHGGNTLVTSPVRRGRWFAAAVICQPPDPPNAVFTLPGGVEAGTMKQRLSQHTASTACSGCHKIMDNIGLGLENFDTFGKWRNQYDNPTFPTIDPSGELPGSFTFSGPADMFDQLAEEPRVRTCLATQMMRLGLAREIQGSSEQCAAGALGQAYVSRGSTLSDLVTGVILSAQFRAQTGEAAQ